VNELSYPVYKSMKALFGKEGRNLMDQYIALIKGEPA